MSEWVSGTFLVMSRDVRWIPDGPLGIRKVHSQLDTAPYIERETRESTKRWCSHREDVFPPSIIMQFLLGRLGLTTLQRESGKEVPPMYISLPHNTVFSQPWMCFSRTASTHVRSLCTSYYSSVSMVSYGLGGHGVTRERTLEAMGEGREDMTL